MLYLQKKFTPILILVIIITTFIQSCDDDKIEPELGLFKDKCWHTTTMSEWFYYQDSLLLYKTRDFTHLYYYFNSGSNTYLTYSYQENLDLFMANDYGDLMPNGDDMYIFTSDEDFYDRTDTLRILLPNDTSIEITKYSAYSESPDTTIHTVIKYEAIQTDCIEKALNYQGRDW